MTSPTSKVHLKDSLQTLKCILEELKETRATLKRHSQLKSKDEHYRNIMKMKSVILSASNMNEMMPFLSKLLQILFLFYRNKSEYHHSIIQNDEPPVMNTFHQDKVVIFLSYMTSVKKLQFPYNQKFSHCYHLKLLRKSFAEQFCEESMMDVSRWILQKRDIKFGVYYDVHEEESNVDDIIKNGDQYRLIRKGFDVLNTLANVSLAKLCDSTVTKYEFEDQSTKIMSLRNTKLSQEESVQNYSVEQLRFEFESLKAKSHKELNFLKTKLNELKQYSLQKNDIANKTLSVNETQTRQKLIEEACRQVKTTQERLLEYNFVLKEYTQDMQHKSCRFRFTPEQLDIVVSEFTSLKETINAMHRQFDELRIELKSQWQTCLESLVKEQETFKNECKNLETLDTVFQQVEQAYDSFKTNHSFYEKNIPASIPNIQVLDPEDFDKDFRASLLNEVMLVSLEKQPEKYFTDLEKYERVRKWHLKKTT